MADEFYTDEQNAQIVIALLKAHGVRKVVASPGTTNIPITGSIQNDSFFEVWSAADERSAAYIACGLAAESGEVVALSCTGATASRNYLPGLTEAYYRKLPLVAITSMTTFSSVGNLVPQSIDRSLLPKDAVRASVFVPTVKDEADFANCELLVNKILLETVRHGGGPVHINLETSYKGTFKTVELPAVRVIHRVAPTSSCFPVIPSGAKVAVFLGAHKPFTRRETEVLETFVKAWGAVVFCDHTSAYKGFGRILSALSCSQGLVGKSIYSALKPDLVIHIGEVSGDYPSQGAVLSDASPVWRVSEDGEVRGRFKQLEYVFEMREVDFFQRYAQETKGECRAYFQAWKKYDADIRGFLPDIPFSNAWIASVLAPALSKNSVLHLGILNSLRCWNMFEVDSTIRTASNVGGFGIDGCVSTLIGASLVDKSRICYGVFGDLAFFYDLNSLGNHHIGHNLRILLVNNGGGGEFALYSHMGSQFGAQTGDYIAAAGHYGNKSARLVKHYAEDLGFTYLRAGNKEEFYTAMKSFVSPDMQDHSVLLECFVDMQCDSDALAAMDHIDTSVNPGLSARRLAGRVLPSNIKMALKNVFRN